MLILHFHSGTTPTPHCLATHLLLHRGGRRCYQVGVGWEAQTGEELRRLHGPEPSCVLEAPISPCAGAVTQLPPLYGELDPFSSFSQ